MKAPEIRKFRHPIFRFAPYYVDYGDGLFGGFSVPALARRAAEIWSLNQK